jgi:hypothetical protein
VLLGHGYAIPTQHSTHILQALQMLRICLFGLAKRQLLFIVKCHAPCNYRKYFGCMTEMKINLLEDFMKSILSKLVPVLWIGLFFSSCAVSNLSSVMPDSMITPGENESVIIIKRDNKFAGSALNINVYVDHIPIMFLRNGDNRTAVIPNGRHILELVWEWEHKRGESRFMEIEVKSEIIIYRLYTIWGPDIVLTETDRQKLVNKQTGTEGINQ